MISLLCSCDLQGPNEKSMELLSEITNDGKIYMVASEINQVFFIRFVVCAASTQENHIDFAWEVINNCLNKLVAAADSKTLQPISTCHQEKN